MSKLTLEEAISHCLEVAEKNDGEAEVYDLLAKNHNNPYEKLTASRFYTDCAECAADHRQLAEWLQELKQWRENPFKMIKDICAAHDWCPDCQLSDHCIKASGWALSYPSEWEVE